MDLNEIVRDAAKRMDDVSIEVDGYGVAIGEDIYLQGDEADAFTDEAHRLYEEAGEVTLDECYACVAEPYVEALS